MSTLPLSQLVQQLPAVSADEVDDFFGSFEIGPLAAEGRKVASDRVVTDTSRLYGLAAEFWSGASPAQQTALTGFSAEFLALAAHEAHRLEQANEQFQRRRDDDRTKREITAKDLGACWGTSIRWKNHAAKALRPIAGGDTVRLTALRLASSATEDPDELVRRLQDCATLARKWIADPTLTNPVKRSRVTEAYAARLEQAAKDLTKAAEAARTRKTVQVSQGDLDVLDGRNLYLIRQIIDVFDEAHELDPSVPRLTPIALANVLGRRRSGRAPAAGETESDVAGEGELGDEDESPETD